MDVKQERTQRILDAAAHQFIQFGYDRANVSDIAKAVGVSKATLYLHFDSKEAMFEGLLLREMERHSNLWFDLVEQDSNGGTLAGMYKNVLLALQQVPFMGAVLTKDRDVLGSYLKKPNNLLSMTDAAKMRSEFVKMMQEAGGIRADIKPTQVANIMNMLSYGLLNLDDDTDLEETIETIGLVLDAGLAPPDGGNPEAGKAIIQQMKQASKAYYDDLRAEQEKRER